MSRYLVKVSCVRLDLNPAEVEVSASNLVAAAVVGMNQAFSGKDRSQTAKDEHPQRLDLTVTELPD